MSRLWSRSRLKKKYQEPEPLEKKYQGPEPLGERTRSRSRLGNTIAAGAAKSPDFNDLKLFPILPLTSCDAILVMK